MDQLSGFLNQLLVSNPNGPTIIQILLATLVAYAGGVLSSFTPCVYPMIPITVGVIGGLQESNSVPFGTKPWKRVLARTAAYLGGMVFVYSFLGVAASLTGKIFGTFTNTSAWYLILGGILTFSALTMAELIPFDPITWTNAILDKFKKHKGHSHHHVTHTAETLWSAAGLGASSGILSSPCTTPVLTVILAFIAKSQSVVIGLSLMVGFSLGLGSLLILISLFTGALQILPRSGKWMKTVKVVSGVILLIFGEYLIFKAGTLRVR